MKPRPQDIITPASFAVAPELLGKPLARPRRRLLAMLIDLSLVSVLVAGGVWTLAIGAAVVLFRAAARGPGPDAPRRRVRTFLRVAGATVVVVLVFVAIRVIRDEADEPGMSFRQVAGLAGEMRALAEAESKAQADTPASRIVQRLRAMGTDSSTLAEMLDEIVEKSAEQNQPLVLLALEEALAREVGWPGAGDSVAADTAVARLRRELAEARATNRRLSTALAAARQERGFISFVIASADDIGLGFGWTGLYFTAFLALWRGQTPGKRLLRLRVLRLDAKAIGWWAAFERFGGYTASVFTGLLGFAQILWDRNRQALHDKISETVVVSD